MKINFQKTALAVGISTALLGGASLANAHDWSGMYVGGTLGEGTLTGSANNYYGESSSTESGEVYGLTFGYNLQNGSSVYGVEVDMNQGTLSEGSSDYGSNTYWQEATWDWYSTVRGRAGLAVDNTLLYVTAGLAIVGTDQSYCDNGPGNCNDDDGDNASSNDTQYGVAYGGGIEMALSNNLSVKGEIMHVDLDTDAVRRDGGGDYDVNFSSSLNTVRIGANYKF